MEPGQFTEMVTGGKPHEEMAAREQRDAQHTLVSLELLAVNDAIAQDDIVDVIIVTRSRRKGMAIHRPEGDPQAHAMMLGLALHSLYEQILA